jgi:hypothetical protein
MSALRAGLELCLLRLCRRSALFVLAIAWLFVILAAALERRAALAGAADRALTGATFGIALPCVVLLALEFSCSGQRLDGATDLLARFGANRRVVILGFVLGAAAVSTAAGAVLGTSAVLVTRPFSDPDLLGDVCATSWIGALAGTTYGGWLALGSAFGRAGRGRFWVLAVDWLVGSSGTPLGLPFPRGHVAHLLGQAASPSLPLFAAVVVLAASGLLCGLVAAWRFPP